MMLPAETRERLGKLIPMLGSDKEHEVVATVRAIDRTLRAAASDFHGLAALITGHPSAKGAMTESEWARFNYAEMFGYADPVGGDPTNADALTRKFGLRIDGTGWLASWREVSRHCLRLNRDVLRKHGGRFLRDFEITLLQRFRDKSHWPTNAQAAWVETVLARCHQARDAAARAKP